MMYKHMLDECIARAKQDLSVLRRYGRKEEADHVQRRLDSLHKLEKQATKARIGK